MMVFTGLKCSPGRETDTDLLDTTMWQVNQVNSIACTSILRSLLMVKVKVDVGVVGCPSASVGGRYPVVSGRNAQPG